MEINHKRPNIVYILTDDLGFGDLGCYGSKRLKTPNLDALAESGVRFTDAHAPSAVCTPSRYGILTGRYCFRGSLKQGVLQGHSEPLIEPGRLTVAGLLKSEGYRTYAVGKWHLGLGWSQREDGSYDYSQPVAGGPVDNGFDYYFGISASLDMPPYCFIENDRTVGIPSVPKEPLDFSQQRRGGLMVPGWRDDRVNGVLTEKAVEVIRGHGAGSGNGDRQPFFLYLPLTGPHTPWAPAEAFQGRSGIGPRGDLILEMDWTVGEVMRALEEQGLRDDTLIIFTSDNGPHPMQEEVTVHGHAPAGDLRGQKSDIWDGGQRVPYLASWPARVPGGRVCEQLICLTDLMATCASIVGTELPEDAGEDSFDNLPALLDGGKVRDSVVLHSLHGMFALRQGDWKYIAGAEGGGFPKRPGNVIGMPPEADGWQTDLDRPAGEEGPAPAQLYRFDEDRSERRNYLWQYPDMAARLADELERLVAAGRSSEQGVRQAQSREG